MTAGRLLPDPIPYRGYGMLSASELAAVIRVLCAVSTKPQSLIVMTWSSEDQDALIALSRCRYTRTVPRAETSTVHWNHLELTAVGEAYLQQIGDAS